MKEQPKKIAVNFLCNNNSCIVNLNKTCLDHILNSTVYGQKVFSRNANNSTWFYTKSFNAYCFRDRSELIFVELAGFVLNKKNEREVVSKQFAFLTYDNVSYPIISEVSDVDEETQLINNYCAIEDLLSVKNYAQFDMSNPISKHKKIAQLEAIKYCEDVVLNIIDNIDKEVPLKLKSEDLLNPKVVLKAKKHSEADEIALVDQRLMNI